MMKLNIRDKIIGLLVFYFLVALVAIGSTLLVSWRLEGGAAAINDAGRERMRSYRIAFLLEQQLKQPTQQNLNDIKHEIALFERTFDELDRGNPDRPLFLPKDPHVKAQMSQLRRTWQAKISPRINNILTVSDQAEKEKLLVNYRPMLEQFVAEINELVTMVEQSNARATALLRFLQVALVTLALIGTVLLVYLFSHMVVRPVTRLHEGMQRMATADFDVRLPVTSNDELGELANGFNSMAEKLQDIYATLEQRVADKTQHLDTRNRELTALYDVAACLNTSAEIEPLCNNVLARMMPLMNAQGGMIRLVNPVGEQLQIVSAKGVSAQLLAEESCLEMGHCFCGAVARDDKAFSADFSVNKPVLHSCNKEGFLAVAAVPIRSNQRVLGILSLFFDNMRILPPTEIKLLEAASLHLGIAIENQRLAAREREMAVSEERNLLAQELHDSIAQSLAFLNIQVQLLQEDLGKEKLADAKQVVSQISEGVQESYDDVRELLVHFRTRLADAELESAILSALEKFEGQVGVKTHFEHTGPSINISPEHVLQVLHILQESLSNIRKHSNASEVWVCLNTEGECSLTVQDNGKGFDSSRNAGDTHVGIRIMRERAHRFGGHLSISSAINHGTLVKLTWSPGTAMPIDKAQSATTPNPT